MIWQWKLFFLAFLKRCQVFKKLSRKLFHRARARIVLISIDTGQGIEIITRKKGATPDLGVLVVLAMQQNPDLADTFKAAVMTYDLFIAEK